MGLTRRDAIKAGATAAVAAPMVSKSGEAAETKPPAAASRPDAKVRETLLLDFDWHFHFGHAADPAKDFGFGADLDTFAKAGSGVTSAADPDLKLADWKALNLPHDWVVELPFVPSANPPPEPAEDVRAYHGFKPVGRQFPETSIGWYRKSFELPKSDLGKRLVLQFDGVFRAATVILNGYVVGSNASGYRSFTLDVTDFANYGGKNVLVLRVDASLGEGWFYEGAGIYRHVWLHKLAPLHIAPWGVWAKSSLSGNSAAVTLATDLVNDGPATKARIVSTITGPDGRVVTTLKSPELTLHAGEKRTVSQFVSMPQPKLWSPEDPALYHLRTEIEMKGKVIDDQITSFGVRSIRFDAEKGFFLNGKPVKIKGTCNHQDHAGVGSAIPDSLLDWRIQKLKEFGSNAYRSSHNPATPELLDACDRLGMLVMAETRRMSSDEESLADLAAMIRRDRNHPSIIMWSIGNEEPQQTTERGARIAFTMKEVCNALDPTRPITAAMNGVASWGKGICAALDVMGANYHIENLPEFHQRMPQKPLIGSETASTVSTRGVYVRDPKSGYCVAYDTEFPSWASSAETWMRAAMTHSYISGGFVWTGFDYRGEPTPFNRWPNVSSQFGILDTCGFAKDNTYYYKAWWGSEAVLHLFPHWNWTVGQKVNVWCHSNLDMVELFLNGTSLGQRKVEPLKHVEWDVVFAPGKLEARGYKNGQLVLTAVRETAGAPAQIRLSCDRQALKGDRADAAMVAVEILDAQGRLVPDANNLVRFKVEGAGAVIGVGNGDPRSHEADKADSRAAFNGLCAAVVQAGVAAGALRIEASSPGLQSASLSLNVQPVPPRPSL
ncbi:beta-galactosidase [Rhizomicrobium palustre]|uniref:Beta-galactosidase n=1 Tax=Rhizomicrobium palustre TaxID=189966 RepID=A0A846N1K1_9PROT|nr:beta-galactosidase GalA [Rhizomicrobium palustre]NIK89102.1 beta-galactosidase [Rhizomicrobium palustre]